VLLHLHLLVNVLLVLKKDFLALMNHIHSLLIALANSERSLKELEEGRPPLRRRRRRDTHPRRRW
jgi:hypothetical protein